MLRTIGLAAVLVIAAASAVSAGAYDRWREEACGNGGIEGSKCEQAFRRLCGKTPNAACVRRNQGTFKRSSSFER